MSILVHSPHPVAHAIFPNFLEANVRTLYTIVPFGRRAEEAQADLLPFL